ncbi:ABC transporter ATP-binding protein [uncultured Alsobacter sp.]|uniref:dipeptide ABC transporter ATP-binding protein n=1 Tax=uncultured Alsobacter sp. TaxID=1748258 RepID=UPI0025D1FDD9|nr:ABC transporter ATP-binding protein [uncultured Alsobacter sp.]
MATLEARGLTVTAGRGENVPKVLRELSFTVERGQVLGLVGESGAGKSMIGRVIGRSLPTGFRVASGSLLFEGQDLVGLPADRLTGLLGDRIAFIPQEPLTALNPVLTIGAQFGEHLERIGVPRGERRARAAAALKDVRLRDPDALLDLYPFQLSGGMCQRVLIAMAFASEPALIVADEPTTALDVSTQATVVQIIRRMQRDHGTALLFITHDLRLASRVCDDLLVLYAGDVVERGPAADVSAAPRHPYTRALQAANPPLAGTDRRLVTLPDQMPGISRFTALHGCRFAPRCPVADPTCATAVPPLEPVGTRHVVRCVGECLAKAAEATVAAPALVRGDARGETVLTVEGVSKHYPGKRDWLGRRGPGADAVKGADVTVAAGEFVGVVGESGSGKSTLAKLVMGLEEPTSGRIAIDGKPVIANDPASREIRLGALQMVFQDPQSALNPRRPVERLVTQSLEAPHHATTEAERLARARSLMLETGLSPDLLDRYPSQLSGGQKQRVNIARALCVTPRLLVADEIVSGLDVSVQAQILNLLLDLRAARGIGLLFISHDLAVVRYLCDRVMVMKNGDVVEAGPTEEVFSNPRHPYTRALMAAVPPEDPTVPWPPEVVES